MRDAPAAANAGAVTRALGRTDYEATWHAMQDFTSGRTPSTRDEIWLTEHPPVYTLGLAGRREHLLRDNGIPALKVDRDSVLVLRNAGPKGVPGFPEWGMIPVPLKLLQQGIADVVRISDSRMSGTGYGTVVLHVAPEAAAGGPLALVQEGDLDERGYYYFAFAEPMDLRIEVSAGEGHRKVLRIPATELGGVTVSPTTSERGGVNYKDLLLGLALILATAAFVMSVRNARRLGAR